MANFFRCLVLLWVASSGVLLADTVSIPASADTGLHEFAPENNLGKQTHVPAGRTGLFANGKLTRGLYQFDLAGKIPANAEITSATLKLRVVLVPPGGRAASFSVHRLLQRWSEGDKIGNTGQPAEPGEATWLSRGTQIWSNPGGAAGVDYLATPSASVQIANAGTYEFNSPDLLMDVKTWVQNPAANHGWMLKADDESVLKTAKRFGSREDQMNAPELVVHYSLSAEPLRIHTVRKQGGNLMLEWTGSTPAYQLERTDSLTVLDWEPIGSAGDQKVGSVEMTGESGFFRVVGGL